MSPPSISLIEELSSNDIKKLTQLLVLPPKTIPHPVWLREQSDFIVTLPPKLKRPESILPRLAMYLPFGTQKAHLCLSHKQLNPYLIRRIFMQVSAECTTRISRLLENRYLPADIAIHVKVLQTANSLWMSPDLYRVTFQCQPEEERHDRIDSDCDACILAAIGGNIRIVTELRTSMLGRKKKRGKGARLLPLVEGWIEWTGTQNVLRPQSDALAREIRSCRRQMQDARRQMRRNIAEGIVDAAPDTAPDAATEGLDVPLLSQDAAAQAFAQRDEGQSYSRDPDHDEHDNDPENSIISYYAHRLSTANLTLKTAHDESNIHPAFRDSLVFQFQTNSSSHTLLPPRPGNPTAYTNSEPSLKNGHRGASAAATRPTARVRQPPPNAYQNRANQKQMNLPNSTRRNTGYTESVYSRGVNDSGFLAPPSPSRPNSYQTFSHQQQQPPRRARSTEEQAGEYQDLLGLNESQRRRDTWEDFEDEDGEDKNQRGRRDTKVTSFGDFI